MKQPDVVQGRPLYIAGLRQRMDAKIAGPRIASLWRKLNMHGKVEGQIDGQPAYGVSYFANDKEFDYVAGVAVKNGFVTVPEGFVLLEIPEQTWLVFEHRGHVQTLPDTIHKIWTDWFPRQTEWKPAETSAVTPIVMEAYDEERFDATQGAGIVELWVAAAATAKP